MKTTLNHLPRDNRRIARIALVTVIAFGVGMAAFWVIANAFTH